MRSHRLLAIVTALAVVVLMNLPSPAGLRLRALARDQLAPVGALLRALVHEWSDTAAAVGQARAVLRDREGIEHELAALRQRNRRLSRLDDENRVLRELLGFKARADLNLLAAKVVSRGDAHGWWQVVRINRGARHGVRSNLAVISLDGLVGRTDTVTADTADVLLLTDPQCRVACRLPRTGALGIGRGAGAAAMARHGIEMLTAPQPLAVSYVDRDAAIREGDGVVTSGLGGVFPEGLMVGTVRAVEVDRSGLHQRLSVAPAADLGGLRFLWVVLE